MVDADADADGPEFPPSADTLAAARFKSLRPGKKAWGLSDVRSIAGEVRAALPPLAAQLLASGEFKGGNVVVLRDKEPIGRIDVEVNFIWVYAVVKCMPDKVPSSFLLGDMFMEVDRQLEGRLLQNAGKTLSRDGKCELALAQGANLKKLISHLRYMFRGDKTNARC